MPDGNGLPPDLAATYADASLCQLRDIAAAVERLAPPEQGAPRLEAQASTPVRYVLGEGERPSGLLAGVNPRRAGFYLHNAADGTLLLLFGEEEPAPTRYTVPIGPGEWYAPEKIASELVKGPMHYAWVTADDDLSGYPEGIFVPATKGALLYTELTMRLI